MKTALITGANKGIGRQIAKELAERNFHVIPTARSAERGEKATADIHHSGGQVSFVQMDVEQPDSIRSAFSQVEKMTSRLDVLIKKYYPSGKLQAAGTYRSWRIRVSEWTYYDENGQVVKTEDYGQKGDFRDVEDFYQRGEISKAWYEEVMGM